VDVAVISGLNQAEIEAQVVLFLGSFHFARFVRLRFACGRGLVGLRLGWLDVMFNGERLKKAAGLADDGYSGGAFMAPAVTLLASGYYERAVGKSRDLQRIKRNAFDSGIMGEPALAIEGKQPLAVGSFFPVLKAIPDQKIAPAVERGGKVPDVG